MKKGNRATESNLGVKTYKAPTRKTAVTASLCARVICKVHTKGRGIRRRMISVTMFGTAVPIRNFLTSKQSPCTVGFQRELAGMHLKIAPSSYARLLDAAFLGFGWPGGAHGGDEPRCHHSEHDVKG